MYGVPQNAAHESELAVIEDRMETLPKEERQTWVIVGGGLALVNGHGRAVGFLKLRTRL